METQLYRQYLLPCLLSSVDSKNHFLFIDILNKTEIVRYNNIILTVKKHHFKNMFILINLTESYSNIYIYINLLKSSDFMLLLLKVHGIFVIR